MNQLLLIFLLSIAAQPLTSMSNEFFEESSASLAAESEDDEASQEDISVVADPGSIINATDQYHDPKKNQNYITALTITAHNSYKNANANKQIKGSKTITINSPRSTITKTGTTYNRQETCEILTKLNIPNSEYGYYLRITASKPIPNSVNTIIIKNFGKNNGEKTQLTVIRNRAGQLFPQVTINCDRTNASDE